MRYDGDLSERDIGQQLYASHNTIHSHLRSICRKLGVSLAGPRPAADRELRLLEPRRPATRAHASVSPGR